MLIKFDKIKFLEDFYNLNKVTKNQEKECIKLDVDINQNELFDLCKQIFMSHSKRIQAQEKTRYWAMNSIAMILKTLANKKN